MFELICSMYNYYTKFPTSHKISKKRQNSETEDKWDNDTHLVQDRLPLLGLCNSRQLHVPHFLHLLVHVYLLLELLDFSAKQAHRVLPVVMAGDGSGTCGVDGRDPVFQFSLAACLHGDRQ